MRLILAFGSGLLSDITYLSRAARIYMYYQRSARDLRDDSALLFDLMEQNAADTDTESNASSLKEQRSLYSQLARSVCRTKRINDRYITLVVLLVFGVIFMAMAAPSFTADTFTETLAMNCPGLSITSNVYLGLTGACEMYFVLIILEVPWPW